MENKGFGFTAQQVMDDVLDYAKVLVTVQSYAKAQSYVKATGKPSYPKDIRLSWRRAAVEATPSK